MMVSLRNRPAVHSNELPHGDWSHFHLRLRRPVLVADLPAEDPFAAVPAQLREIAQWVCWTYVVRNGRKTKCPVCPTSGRYASSTDPATWGTFEQALAGWRSLPGMDGIGFVFTAEDEFCGIDLDHCMIDGVVVPAAQAVVDQFSTYTEISPSGAGLKLILKGKKPVGAGSRSNAVEDFDHVEVYDNKRFFTVTGKALKGTPRAIAHCQNQLDEFCERQWPSTSRRIRSNRIDPSVDPFSEAPVIPDSTERERRCTAYLQRCPDAISGNGGHDATLRAACECFRFGLDDAAARRVMHWFNATKTGGERWSEAELDHKLTAAREKVAISGEFASRLVETCDAMPVTTGPQVLALRTDVGNAARLVHRYGKKIRYCQALGCWFIWDERNWHRDDRGQITRLCKQTALGIFNEAKKREGREQQECTSWAIASQRRDRINAMAALAQSEVAVSVEELDADPWAFNCLNGTLDLRTGTLHTHRPSGLVTKLAPVVYDASSECPRFMRFLDEIFRGDGQVIRYMQRWQGYCLTGDVREQYLPILYGAGNNGKSVYLDTISGLMGDYAGEAPPDLLTMRKQPQHPTEIADLRGKRLVVASETERSSELRLQMIKRLTGNARLKGRGMREDFFEFSRTHKMILVTNNRPELREDTESVWRRLRLVPFNVIIPRHKRDTDLLRKLRSEWPGILAWMVRGCLDWQREGLPEPDAIVAATASYRAFSNSLDTFILERCSLGEGLCCVTSELIESYSEWCSEHQCLPLLGRAFATALKGKRCMATKLRGVRHWRGIALDYSAIRFNGQNGQIGRISSVEPLMCAHEEGN